MKKTFIILFFLFYTFKIFGQDDINCNIQFVVDIHKNIENLNKTHISNLLKTIDTECENNIEFSQFSNEMLFKALEKSPEFVLLSFHELRFEIDTAYILNELESPIHDGIDVRTILNKLEELEIKSKSKAEIIKRLKKTINKN